MKYYHMKTIHSRRFSKIIMLKNNLWEWMKRVVSSKQWSMITIKKVCDYVKKAWLIPSEIDKKNQTDVCMILKVSQPQLVS